ncbi:MULTISPECIES: WbqC family protein [unclassified Agarivorans]|uniref:WbqC family protein n=1 Tax=unclassified Agarivorans TaxID=2636026 RepID=UPI0026E224B5|nr:MULTISPECIES: WbqC family protein [unclassified Agarivorans]MDO6684713.1 WbqC family protein [Agarivorans sp. 3_MG-2023]MDO6715126.1 WbqC family protein [Agarivorans sp. 2_MG-2023]
MKKISILQSNYIPWRGYFEIISQSDIFVVYDTVQYTKNDWRNRNKILTNSGVQWLTVPVKHKNLSQEINSIEINNKIWSKKHWKTIEQNYKKSNFFEEYHDNFKNIYNQEWKYLSDLNITLIKAVNKCLDIKTEIVNSRDLDIKVSNSRNQKLINICNHFDANLYISGPAAKDYLEEKEFKRNSIEIKWMDYSKYKSYQHKSELNYENLSVLDLIFNLGPNAKKHITL